MTLNFKTLKPGSMIISKRYNTFKRLWYKLLKRELPYNRITLFTYNTSIMNVYSNSKRSTDLLLELKKDYTKDEISLLTTLLIDEGREEDFYAIGFKGEKEISKLLTILNTVRSYAIKNIPVSKEDLILHDTKLRKYYYVNKLSEEENWDICIY